MKIINWAIRPIANFLSNVKRTAYITAIWFFAGCSLTLAHADFGVPYWDDVWYIWDAISVILFAVLIYNLIPKNLKWIFKPVIIYSSIRLIWLIIIPVTGMEANHPMALSILSWIFIIGAILVFGIDLIKEWKRSK